MLSIIIPVFNSFDFVERTIDSILSQDCDFLKEIIIVDDGSTEGNIGKILEKLNTNKLRIVKKEHSNAGDARNLGIEVASGDFIWFIDSDDIISPKALLRIKETILFYKCDIDIIEFAYNKIDYITGVVQSADLNERRVYLSPKIKMDNIYSLNDVPEILTTIAYVWNKIYKLDFIKRNHICCSSLTVSNDVFFKLKAELLAKKIAFIKDVLYIKLINRKGNQLRSLIGKDRLCFLQALNELDDYLMCNKFDINSNIYKALLEYKFNQLLSVHSMISDEYKEVVKEYIEKSYKILPNILKHFIKNNVTIKSHKNNLLKEIGIFDSLYINNNDVLISIIITTYNLENYIDKTLSSITTQDILPNNYEIIIADDCSLDGTMSILNKYANIYKNITVIASTTNQGFGKTINNAIKKAKGEYILILDGDDFVDYDFIRTSFEKIVGTIHDFIIFDYKIFIEEKNKSIKSHDNNVLLNLYRGANKLKEEKLKMLTLQLNSVPWRKIYRKSFLYDKGICFPETRHLYGDNTFHWQVILSSRSFGFSPEAMYYHRKGREGQSIFGKGKKFLDFIVQYNNIKNFLILNNMFEDYKLNFYKYVLDQTLNVLPKLGSDGLRREFLNDFVKIMSDCSEKDLAELQIKYKVSTYRYILYQNLLKGKFLFAKIKAFILYYLTNFSKKIKIISNYVKKIFWR